MGHSMLFQVSKIKTVYIRDELWKKWHPVALSEVKKHSSYKPYSLMGFIKSHDLQQGQTFWSHLSSSSGSGPHAPSVDMSIPRARCPSLSLSQYAAAPRHGPHEGQLGRNILNETCWIERRALWKGSCRVLQRGICIYFTLEWFAFFPSHEKPSRAMRLTFLIEPVNDGYYIRFILGNLTQMYWLAPPSVTLK